MNTPSQAAATNSEIESNDLELSQSLTRHPALEDLDTMERLLRRYGAMDCDEFVVPPLSKKVMEHIQLGRRSILNHMLSADAHLMRLIIKHPLFQNAYLIRTSGLLHTALEANEQKIVEQARTAFLRGWRSPAVLNFFGIMQLYYQPHDLPFMIEGVLDIDPEIAGLYFSYCIRDPAYIVSGDDRKHADHLLVMMRWFIDRIKYNTSDGAWLSNALLPHIRGLSLNSLLNAEFASLPIVKARAELIYVLSAFLEYRCNYSIPPFSRKMKPTEGRPLRIGYIVRTICKGRDTELIMSEISHFNTDKVEIYLYPRDVLVRNYEHNAPFYKKLFSKVKEIHSIGNQSFEDVINILRKDELDILAYQDSILYGFDFFDLQLAYRVAPLQIALNRIISISTGLDSFDYLLVAQTPESVVPILQSEATETIQTLPGTLVAYDPEDTVIPKYTVTRQTLGILDHEVILLCGSGVDKIVPAVCEAFAHILSRVPSAKLILTPFSPSWSGMVFYPLLEARLAIALKKYNVSRDRIIVINELDLDEVPQFLELADVYLAQWPLGGTTWIRKCLDAGLPLVVKDSTLLRGIGDQSLVRGAGFEDLVARDEEDYVRLSVELATNKEKREDFRTRMRAARHNMPHRNLALYSQQMQEVYLQLAEKTAIKHQIYGDIHFDTPSASHIKVQDQTRPMVVSLVGQDGHGILRHNSTQFGKTLEKRGYDWVIIDLLNPQAGQQFDELTRNRKIAFAYGFSGVGSYFKNGDQVIWDKLRIPFLAFHLDNPCHQAAQHGTNSQYVANVYGVKDYQETQARFIRSTRPHFLIRGHVMVEPNRTLLPWRDRPINYLFVKSGTNPGPIAEESKLLPKPLYDAFWDCVRYCEKHTDFLLADILARRLNLQPEQINMDSSAFWTMMHLIEYYIRSTRMTWMANMLSQMPATIIGNGWEHIDRTNSKATFLPGKPVSEIVHLYGQSKFVFNINPAFNHGAEERVFLGLNAWSGVISDTNEFTRHNLSMFPNFYGFDWSDPHKEDKILTFLNEQQLSAAHCYEGWKFTHDYTDMNLFVDSSLEIVETIKARNLS